MNQTIDRLACPEWCAQQDHADDVLVQHESTYQVVRASGDPDREPPLVEVLAERWQEGDGPVLQTVKLRVPAEVGGDYRYDAAFEFTTQQARRAAALLIEYADLLEETK